MQWRALSRMLAVWSTLALLMSGCASDQSTISVSGTSSIAPTDSVASGDKLPTSIANVTLAPMLPAVDSNQPTEISWSLDGATIAVNNSLGLRVLEADTLYERCAVSTSGSFVFSPDGKQLAVWGGAGGDRGLRFYGAVDCGLQKEINGAGTYPGQGNSDYSFNGELFAAARIEGGVRIWNTHDWSEFRTIPGDSREGVETVVFSPNSKQLIVATKSSKQYWWDLEQNAQIYMNPHDALVYHLAYQVGIAEAGQFRMLNFNDPYDRGGERPAFIDRLSVVSPSGRQFANRKGADTTQVDIYDLPTNQYRLTLASDAELNTVVQYGLSVTDLSFSPDETKIAAAYRDGVVRIWDISGGPDQVTIIVQTP